MVRVLVFLGFLSTIQCDLYLHNPRGSNNRLDEANRERANGNRMFDSQNNNRGGYNVGSLYYYSGSVLPIEWTNQHSCGDGNSHCELILQYMCSDSLRDGVTTTTIPENPMQCKNYDCNTDTTYGMNENFDYYVNCKLRDRNKGLFTADQNLKNKRRSAKHTRQNPGGTRRGYECPEERDYYPYWHPTPWKDIAIMTNDARRCSYYTKESENVKSRWACVVPHQTMVMNANKGLKIPNNKEDCEKFRWPTNDPDGVKAEWKEFSSHDLPAPECRETQFSRDNHLGNGLGGYPNLFNWTVPDMEHERCVLRMRYNISTAEYDGWDGSVNSKLNEVKNNEGSLLDLSKQYKFASQQAANDRGYVFENNPDVKIFEDADFELELAINTAQYGRTFQDRSHTFSIKKRPADLSDSTIHNVNVRGKRGNIVQVYPAVEYDFVPNTLKLMKGDYVHFQWTGSNTNPNNNDGQGRAGSDRSNIVLQGEQVYAEGNNLIPEKYGHWGRSYPAHINNVTFLGLEKDDIMDIALLTNRQFGGEMSELDDAGTYYDLGPRKVTKGGQYQYMCTRNNNFSNRSQKGKIVVVNYTTVVRSIGWTGGTLSGREANVSVDEGVFMKLQVISLEEWSVEDGEKAIKAKNREIGVGDKYASKFILLHPAEPLTADGKAIKMTVQLDKSLGNDVKVYRSNPANFATWIPLETQVENGVAAFSTTEGGAFVARTAGPPIGGIVGGVVAALVVVAVVIGTGIYCRRNPDKWQSVRSGMANVKRSTQSKV